MKRNISIALAIGTMVLAILTGMAWYNNVMIARQWTPENGHGSTYVGPLTSFNWTAVDFSTVSTLIPFVGFCFISAGFLRIALAKENQPAPEHFPFYKTYSSVTVALGLIGTVIGLIMIGYYPPEKVKMADLILCLRTALFSTLVALVWVFLVVIPIQYIMKWFHAQVTGYSEKDDTAAWISKLGASAAGAAKGLSTTGVETGGLNKIITKVCETFTTLITTANEFKDKMGVDAAVAVRNACTNLDLTCKAIIQSIGSLRAESASRQATAVEELKLVQGLTAQFGLERNLRMAAQSSEAEAKSTAANAVAHSQNMTGQRDDAVRRAAASEASRKASEAKTQLAEKAKIAAQQEAREAQEQARQANELLAKFRALLPKEG